MVQINSEFSGQVYLPLVAGYLQSYFQAHSKIRDKFEFTLPIYKREEVSLIVNKLSKCQIVGFSIYVWNEQLSLAVAKKLKEVNKEIVIIFGGPQVPDFAEKFLIENDFVDLCIHNEGEEAFKEVLERYYEHSSLAVANTSSLVNENGIRRKYLKVPNRPKIRDLDLIPSPFLNGYFNKLLEHYPEQTFLGLWESNRGCPFSCTFCDWGSSTASKVNQFGIERLKSEITWIGKSQIPFVFVCDANFGLLPRDEEIALYVANTKNQYGFPEAFSVQNTKNVKERAFKVQKILSDAGLNKGVTLSMQSLHSETLEFIKRDNISLDTYRDLQDKFMKSGVTTYSDLILGLPGETLSSWKKGIGILIKNGQHNRIQFNNLSLLPNAEMSSEFERSRAGFVTVKSQIVNTHGSKSELLNDVGEFQELVVGTSTMNKSDWILARVYAWWIALLYFDKLFQIPLVFLRKNENLDTAEFIDNLIEFICKNQIDVPILSKVNDIFTEKAKAIQNGDIEYVWNSDLIDVFWPADEFIFIDLVKNKEIQKFYSELKRIIEKCIKESVGSESLLDLFKLVDLNYKLLSLPDISDDDIVLDEKSIQLLKEYILILNPHVALENIKIENRIMRSRFKFSDWQKEVVWYGHRSGSYLEKFYLIDEVKSMSLNTELPGHYS